jgi:hypothetical protein
MTQYVLGPIDPGVVSGSELAAILTAWGASVDSSQAGSTRPTYLPSGGIWLNTAAPDNYILMLFNGYVDITLLRINPLNGAVVFPSGSTTSFLAPNGTVSGKAAPDISRNIFAGGSLVGGGDLSQDREFQLANDSQIGDYIPNFYYGRNASNAAGYWPLPASRGNRRREAVYGPGDYTWVAPATCVNCEVEGYAGGSTVYGGVFQADIDVNPGQGYSLHVGGANDLTHFNGQVVVASNGTFASDPNLPGNVSDSVGRRRNGINYEFGAPGCIGIMRISWLEPA